VLPLLQRPGRGTDRSPAGHCRVNSGHSRREPARKARGPWPRRRHGRRSGAATALALEWGRWRPENGGAQGRDRWWVESVGLVQLVPRGLQAAGRLGVRAPCRRSAKPQRAGRWPSRRRLCRRR